MDRSIIMKNRLKSRPGITSIFCLALLAVSAFGRQAPQSRFTDVNGVRLHYLVAGQGDPVVLLQGYAETSQLWLPLMKELEKTPLPRPMLVLTGEKASGEFLIQQGRMVATNVEGVIIHNSGHWLMEEAPEQVIPKLLEILNRPIAPVHS